MDDKQYRTSDLYEAAALYATGEKMVGIEAERMPYKFVFRDYKVCESKSFEYINEEMAVVAKKYADAVKLLKNRINSL